MPPFLSRSVVLRIFSGPCGCIVIPPLLPPLTAPPLFLFIDRPSMERLAVPSWLPFSAQLLTAAPAFGPPLLSIRRRPPRPHYEPCRALARSPVVSSVPKPSSPSPRFHTHSLLGATLDCRSSMPPSWALHAAFCRPPSLFYPYPWAWFAALAATPPRVFPGVHSSSCPFFPT